MQYTVHQWCAVPLRVQVPHPPATFFLKLSSFFFLFLSVFKNVEHNCERNNVNHHTSDVTVKELLVRRGQPFTLNLELSKPFTPDRHPLTISGLTGQSPV